MYTDILYEIKDNMGKITINRPKVLNAWTKNTKEEILDALREADKDERVKVVIITGVGDRAFCAGHDLKEGLEEPKETKADKAVEWITEFDHLYWVMRHFEKPIIAAVNGVAVGSGWQLALLCDFRIASENARFAFTEIDVGFACIIGSTLIYLTSGEALAKELVLTGRFMDAKEALKVNLVNKVVSQGELEKTVYKLAKELVQKPPVAMMLNKKWFTMLSDQRYLDCISFAKEAHKIGFASGEPKRWGDEFFEKRER